MASLERSESALVEISCHCSHHPVDQIPNAGAAHCELQDAGVSLLEAVKNKNVLVLTGKGSPVDLVVLDLD